jgi:DNA-binding winged helix-turn-helix (wHTH) protein
VAEPLDAARHPLTVVIDDDDDFADFVESWLRHQGLKAVPLGAGPNPVPGILRGRRYGSPAPSSQGKPSESRIELGSLAIDSARRTVEVRGVEIHLTPTEFRLLRYLTERPDRLVGHNELLGTVWGPGYEDDIHLLQVTMRSLRARIAVVTDEPLIETVYGAGYRMASQGDGPVASAVASPVVSAGQGDGPVASAVASPVVSAGQRSWAGSVPPVRSDSEARSGHRPGHLGPHGAAA